MTALGWVLCLGGFVLGFSTTTMPTTGRWRSVALWSLALAGVLIIGGMFVLLSVEA